jgi:micrococcal nuclease
MTRRVFLIIFVLCVGIVPYRSTVAQEVTCSSFVFREDAELAYESSPTISGLNALAPDSNGITCSELPTLSDGGIWISTPPDGAQMATVDEVVDGDTIDVTLAETGSTARIRLVVVNTPEVPDECMGSEASEFVQDLLLPGEQVWLTTDARDVDPYDRLLRHVWYVEPDGSIRLLEYELTRRGLAWAKDYGEHSAYLPFAAEGMRSADVADLGIWSACENAGSIDQHVEDSALILSTGGMKPLSELLAGSGQSGNCDPSYPSVCIPPAPPDLDCGDVPYRRFEVLPPDPHNFDRNHDGVGCES